MDTEPDDILDDLFRISNRPVGPLKYPRSIPRSDFRRITRAHKYNLLGDALSRIDLDLASRAIDNLRRFSPSAAKGLVLKSTALDSLVFRLLPKNVGIGNSRRLKSFVALSYVWGTREVDTATATRKRKRSARDVELPISPILFQAVLNLLHDEEALWFDRGCIDQTSNLEKTHSIGAMDLVYSSARLVVAVLDDVMLGKDEARHLKLASRQRKMDLATFIYKSDVDEKSKNLRISLSSLMERIVSSKLFTRAWCIHETTLAEKLLFLLPTALGEPLFVTGSTLEALLASFKHIIESGREFIHVVRPFRNMRNMLNTARSPLSSVRPFETSIYLLVSFQTIEKAYASGNPTLGAELRQLDGNIDKFGIVLNIARSGLALDRSGYIERDYQNMTLEECYRRIMMIALAMSPLPLLVSGRLSRKLCSHFPWLKIPLYVISHIPLMKELEVCPKHWEVSIDCSGKCRFIDLDILFLKPVRRINRSKSRYTKAAELFLDSGPPVWESSFNSGRWTVTQIYSSLYERFTTRLALLLEGYEGFFTHSRHSKHNMPLPKILRPSLDMVFTTDRTSLKQSLQEPSASAAFKDAVLTLFSWIKDIKTDEPPRSAILLSAEFSTGASLVFSGCCEAKQVFAIPIAFAGKEFCEMPCCWILEKKGLQNNDWVCVEKTFLKGDLQSKTAASAMDLKEKFSKRVRIWGPGERSTTNGISNLKTHRLQYMLEK